MIPVLYDKTGNSKLGELNNCIECLVEEERNGVFEVSLVYPINDDIFNQLQEENIIVCNANDTLKSQKFRIYATKKLMANKVEVYARHISFDLAYDRVESINITNQSCEYALNTIFRQSQFSTNYRGHSDVVNAQDYTISNVNCIEAIAGAKGSIIDTYGTGAEILRDNTDIHVLNRRGHDNEATIEYAKNLTGFELEEDYSELVTRINAFARYTDNENEEERIIEAKNIDSPLISNYSHPYIASIDYSDRFEQDEVPTSDKLIELAKKEYSVNKKDKPKQNFKIEFIPLSKCVGYEGLEDKISICDTVTIIDTRYGINTKAKVIRTVFNVLKDRYESMELGEPRTSLGDIIQPPSNDTNGSTSNPNAPQGPPGQDGNNGEDAIYLNLTNDSHIIPTLSDGTGGNYTGCETEMELYKGSDKILYNVDYAADSVEGVTGNLVGNIYTVTDMTVDNCNIRLQATYNQRTYTKYFSVSKNKQGKDGKDAYTINITNDSHIFEAENNGNISKEQTTSTEILVFKGVDVYPFEIGELPSVNGLELSKDDTTVTIKALTGSKLADTGEFEIPIIVDDLEFKKVFSWSKAKKGQDGSIGDFPNTLPSAPVLEAKVYGFANIELSWTYENKVYYQYELYASKTRDFIPNTFDLIHQGQTSSFLYQALPNETWYFKVCAINSYGDRTEFSNQVEVITRKIDDMSNYFEEAAIGKAVVGSLTADYMEAGIIKGNWIDAKNLTVTDGNGKRTLDIDSFGNVNLDVTSLNINSESVATNNNLNNKVNEIGNSLKEYTNSQISVVNDEINLKVNKSEFNSLIQQNAESVKIAFNNISSEWRFDANKFTNTVNGKVGLSLGSGRLNVNRFSDGKPVGYFGQTFSGEQQYWGNILSGTHNSYFTMIGYNPNVVNEGDSTSSGFDPFMVCVYYPFGSAYTSQGIYVKKPLYAEKNVDIYGTLKLRQDVILNSTNSIGLGTTSNALRQISSNIYTSGNKDMKIGPGVTEYGGLIVSGGGYFFPERGGGAYTLGTTSNPFYRLYSVNTYSSNNIVYNSQAKAFSIDNSNDVIDNIDFISTYEKDSSLVMDITKIADTNYVEVDEENNAYMNDSEMIKLLIKEVKELKEEIKSLKNKQL